MILNFIKHRSHPTRFEKSHTIKYISLLPGEEGFQGRNLTTVKRERKGPTLIDGPSQTFYFSKKSTCLVVAKDNKAAAVLWSTFVLV